MTTRPVTKVPARIMVMGPPGSGKSTLARMLGERLGLPVWHADALFHDPGWIARPRNDFIADMTAIAARPAWVIDGNYSSAHYGPAIRDRLTRADRIIPARPASPGDYPANPAARGALSWTATARQRAGMPGTAGCGVPGLDHDEMG